jgi:hypothetical protein
LNIADYNLNSAELPPLEILERNSLRQDGIYLLFNSFSIIMYVGRQCDPYFYEQLFKVSEYTHINKNCNEDEIFSGSESSPYLTALSDIIN